MRCHPVLTAADRGLGRVLLLWIAALLVLGPGASASEPGAATEDPIATELARCRSLLSGLPEASPDTQAIREIAGPVLGKAEGALVDGRRLAALHYLALARMNVAAQASLPTGVTDPAAALPAFEAEWRRVGAALEPTFAGPGRPELTGIPAAVRGVAEAALAEVKPYYDASLEYGRNTSPEYGWFYLGAAQAQLDFARFCSRLAVPGTPAAPAVRAIAPELDALEGEMLAAYRPPASIESHPQFIRLSATVKQARELDGAALRYGALYLYLDASLRLSRLEGSGRSIDAAEAARRAREVEQRLDREPADHSLARLFVELALAAAAGPDPKSKGGETALAVFDAVMPRYFAALGPAAPRPPTPSPAVTVTLVRWPYT